MQDQPNKQPDRVQVKNHPGIFFRLDAKGKRRYCFSYYDSNGKQRWKTVGDNLTEAEAVRDELRSHKRKGGRVAPTNRRFTHIAADWLNEQEHRVRPRTYEDYQLRLERVNPYIGPVRISEMENRHIVGLIRFLSEPDNGRNRDSGYSPATIKNTLGPVSRVFKYAVRRGYISHNPFDLLDSDERPKGDSEREQRILDKDELGKLLAKSPDRYRALLATAAFTGLRLMELLGLRWMDIDFDGGFVRVHWQLSRRRGEGLVRPKTKQASRDVVLMPTLGKMLREHRLASPFSEDLDYIFTTGTGEPFGWSNVTRRGLHKAVQNAKLKEPRPRFHDLRHTYASLLIAQGANVEFVRSQLGHKDATVTLRVYAHLFGAQEHAARTRQLLEDGFGATLTGKAVVREASEEIETEEVGQVLGMAALQAKRGVAEGG
jgi:integrase